MVSRKSPQEPMWDEVLTDESLALMTLEPIVKKGTSDVCGYKPVFAGSDPRAKSRPVRWCTPPLYVSGGDVHMHGSSFKDKGELDRMITVKTTKTFSQCP